MMQKMMISCSCVLGIVGAHMRMTRNHGAKINNKPKNADFIETFESIGETMVDDNMSKLIQTH